MLNFYSGFREITPLSAITWDLAGTNETRLAQNLLAYKLSFGSLVTQRRLCLKIAPGIANSPRLCSRTWSATALSRNATRHSHLSCLRNTADSCARFFQNIRVLKSRQLEMVSWSNFLAPWRQCSAGLKFNRRSQISCDRLRDYWMARCTDRQFWLIKGVFVRRVCQPPRGAHRR